MAPVRREADESRARRSVWPVVLLLGVFAVSAGVSLRWDAATFDETAHLPAGYLHLDRGDFSVNPEHPPLAKVWAALPLWLSGRHPPHYDPNAPPATDNQWTLGFEFLNGRLEDPVRQDPARYLNPARTAMVGLGVLLGLFVFAWARDLWGRRGGLIALLLFTLSPPLLAHTRLVTTDLAAALGFAATLWCFRRYLRRPSPPWALATGAALGSALLFKFSMLLLPPLLVALGAAWVAWPGDEAPARAARARQTLLGLACAAVVACVLLWAGYRFRYAASPDPGRGVNWAWAQAQEGFVPAPVAWARDHCVLPEAYLFGFVYASGGQNRLAFLHGEQSVTGWWWYFPIAFLLKTPPAFLAILAWVAVGVARRRALAGLEALWIAAPVLVYFGVSMAGRLNLGLRHLLPVYPLLCVLGGGLAVLGWGEAGRRRGAHGGNAPVRRWATIALLAGCVVSYAVATPRYLSYFNALVGGPRGGWHWLVDSNVDWGQDLARLGTWTREHGTQRIHLAYFGTADPKAYGIPYAKVRFVTDFYPREPESRPGPGELLAISVTLLQGVYLDPDGELARVLARRGWAKRAWFDAYLAMRDARVAQAKAFPSLSEWLVSQRYLTPARVSEVRETLLSTWVDRVRRHLTPVGRAGDSILIYRIPTEGVPAD